MADKDKKEKNPTPEPEPEDTSKTDPEIEIPEKPESIGETDVEKDFLDEGDNPTPPEPPEEPEDNEPEEPEDNEPEDKTDAPEPAEDNDPPAAPPKEDPMTDKKPTPPTSKPATGGTGGTPPSNPTRPAPATPASRKFPWWIVALVVLALAFGLYAAFKTDDDKKAKASASSNADDIAALTKTVGTVNAKKADKSALDKVDKKVDKLGADLKSFKKKHGDKHAALDKDREGHMAFTAKNRELICKFHKWSKECRELAKKTKDKPKKAKSSGRTGGSGHPKWRPRRHHSSTPSDSAKFVTRKEFDSYKTKVDDHDRLLGPARRHEAKLVAKHGKEEGRKKYQSLGDQAFDTLQKRLESIQSKKR